MRLITGLSLMMVFSSHVWGHDPYERPLTRLDTGMGPTTAVSVASDLGLTAAAWVNSADNHVYVSLSDGRGMTWGTPVQVDKDTTGSAKSIQQDSCQVLYDDQSGSNLFWIYVIYQDARNDDPNTPLVETDLYLARSSDKGVKWKETLVPKKYFPGTGTVVEYVIEAFDTNHGNHVWVALTVDKDGSSNDELYFLTSHDAGVSFLPAIAVSREAVGAHNISSIGMASDRTQDSHFVFVDDRNGQRTAFYQHTPDAGFTWLPVDKDLGAIGDVDGAPGQAVIAKAGLSVAAAWQEDLGGGKHALYLNSSKDLGLSWSGALQVGGYTPGVDDTDNPAIGYDFTTNPKAVYLAWEDDRNGAGMNDVFVGGSYDNGATFVEERELSASLGGRDPMFLPRQRTQDEMQCAFLRGAPGAEQLYIAERVYAATFWHPAYGLSASHPGAVASFFDVTYDQAYENAIATLVDDSTGSTQAHAGGMRMPFIEANGFLGGGVNVVSFTGGRLTSAVDSGSSTAILGVFLSSSDQPGLPLGDGRFIDLKYDALLTLSLQFHQLLFSKPLGNSIETTTPLFKWKVPSGFSFWVAGLVYDFDQFGNVFFREVTDSRAVIVP